MVWAKILSSIRQNSHAYLSIHKYFMKVTDPEISLARFFFILEKKLIQNWHNLMAIFCLKKLYWKYEWLPRISEAGHGVRVVRVIMYHFDMVFAVNWVYYFVIIEISIWDLSTDWIWTVGKSELKKHLFGNKKKLIWLLLSILTVF